VLAALADGPLPGGPRRPLSASTLQSWLECPARFFLDAVLRVRAPEEQGDDLDARADGKLKHLALERTFRAWRDAGRFPLRGDDAERALLDEALAGVAHDWRARFPSGHALVWRSRLAAVRRLLEAVWRREVDDPPAPGHVPTHLELSFDGLTVAGDAGEPPLVLTGTIDRVDLRRDATGAMSAAVFDYKAGRMGKRTAELKEAAFGESSWQLPLYAAALRAQHGVGEVQLLYYALRELKVSVGTASAWLVVERGDDARPTLGDRLLVHARAIRAGRFDVAPGADACARCGLQPACRIVERRDDTEEAAP